MERERREINELKTQLRRCKDALRNLGEDPDRIANGTLNLGAKKQAPATFAPTPPPVEEPWPAAEQTEEANDAD